MKCDKNTITNTIIVVVISATVSAVITSVLNITDLKNNHHSIFNNNKESEKDTLVSIQIVFRHGDRTPEPGKLYRLDPYNHYSFYPENFGELTTKGRKTAYKLGKLIRKQYKKFLNETFYPGIVKSYVSGYDRTQMSLQCVHAGLFPNENSKLGTPWRPIAYEIFEFDEDDRMGIMAHCKTLKPIHIIPTDNDTIQLFKFLSVKAGQEIKSYYDAIAVSNAFQVETSYGLELPDWGKPLYPEPLLTIDEIAWKQFTEAHIRLGAGGILKMITDSAFDVKTAQHSETDHPKVVLYSAHDYTLTFLRHSMKFPNVDSSNFGAYLIFELHKMYGKFGFKILYNNYKKGHPIVLKSPFCKYDSDDGTFCKLDTFVKNTKWYYDPKPHCY